MHVAAVLKHKGNRVVTVAPDQTVLTAAALLTANRIGAVPVVDDTDHRLAGILSERDIVRGISSQGPEVLNQPVAVLMTRDVLVCRPSDTMSQIMDLMTARRIRHLPVVENGQLHGIISIGDAVKHRLDENELEVQTLRGFLTGTA